MDTTTTKVTVKKAPAIKRNHGDLKNLSKDNLLNVIKKSSMLAQLKEPFNNVKKDLKSLLKKVSNFFNARSWITHILSDELRELYYLSERVENTSTEHQLTEYDVEEIVENNSRSNYDIEDIIENWGAVTEDYVDEEVTDLKDELNSKIKRLEDYNTNSTMSEDEIVKEITIQVNNAVSGHLEKMYNGVTKAHEQLKDPRVKDIKKVYTDSMKLNEILMGILEDGEVTINKDDFKLIQGGF